MAYKQLKLWFDTALVDMLTYKIHSIEPRFQTKSFKKELSTRNLNKLELKPRIELIADTLHSHLGDPFNRGVEILLQILGPENPNETGMFTEFYWTWPIAKYVEKYGISDPYRSLDAIEQITKRGTGEFAIRPFISHHYTLTLYQMIQWSMDENFHVRRLSCEGLRPRLPWANKLQIFFDDPQPILPVLENLKLDSVRYVQNSVANCINDISKDNPAVAKQLIDSWMMNMSDHGNLRYVIKRGIRSLLKNEDEWARTTFQSL